jgi:hypothetical protein
MSLNLYKVWLSIDSLFDILKFSLYGKTLCAYSIQEFFYSSWHSNTPYNANYKTRQRFSHTPSITLPNHYFHSNMCIVRQLFTVKNVHIRSDRLVPTLQLTCNITPTLLTERVTLHMWFSKSSPTGWMFSMGTCPLIIFEQKWTTLNSAETSCRSGSH